MAQVPRVFILQPPSRGGGLTVEETAAMVIGAILLAEALFWLTAFLMVRGLLKKLRKEEPPCTSQEKSD